MALVTECFYNDVYFGEPVPTLDFQRLEARAEDSVLAYCRITAADAEALPEHIMIPLCKAICAQMEYLWEYGITTASFGREADGGFTVGKVSVHNGGSSTTAATGAKSIIAPAVIAYLEQTGLLGRQVVTAGMPPRMGWGWY